MTANDDGHCGFQFIHIRIILYCKYTYIYKVVYYGYYNMVYMVWYIWLRLSNKVL